MKPRENESILADLAAYSIGVKLRTLRAEKAFTLARLASATGFSSALLSKLETNSMVPTLQTLLRICRVYGVGLSHFFCEPKLHSVAITRNAHIAEMQWFKATRRIPLHLPASEARQVSRIIVLPPGVASRVSESGKRTELTTYILEGTLHLNLAGSQEVLKQGDCVVLDTDDMVVWSAPLNAPCRLLCVAVR